MLYYYYPTGGHVVQQSFMYIGRGHYGEHSCEIIMKLDQWPGGESVYGCWTKTAHNSSP